MWPVLLGVLGLLLALRQSKTSGTVSRNVQAIISSLSPHVTRPTTTNIATGGGTKNNAAAPSHMGFGDRAFVPPIPGSGAVAVSRGAPVVTAPARYVPPPPSTVFQPSSAYAPAPQQPTAQAQPVQVAAFDPTTPTQSPVPTVYVAPEPTAPRDRSL